MSSEVERLALIAMDNRKPSIDQKQAREKERLEPGSEPQRLPQPRSSRTRRRHKAALPGSQNADLAGPKPRRGPRGMST